LRQRRIIPTDEGTHVTDAVSSVAPDTIAFVAKQFGSIGLLLAIGFVYQAFENKRWNKWHDDERTERKERSDAERKIREADAAEHRIKWASLVEQHQAQTAAMIAAHKEQISTIVTAHQEDNDRDRKVLERLADAVAMQAHLQTVLDQKISTNQYCPGVRTQATKG
jgi:hypothetical protein